MDLILAKQTKYIVAGSWNYDQRFDVFDNYQEAYSYMMNIYNQVVNDIYEGSLDKLAYDKRIGDVSFDDTFVFINGEYDSQVNLEIHQVSFDLFH